MRKTATRCRRVVLYYMLMTSVILQSVRASDPLLTSFSGTGLADDAALEVLTFESAMQKAFAHNPTIISARLGLELSEISYQDAWETMFMPGVNIGASSVSRYTLAQLPNSDLTSNGNLNTDSTGLRERGSPTSGASIGVGAYRLFNFGKDRDAYEISKISIDRAHQSIKETERSIRFAVINSVYNFKTQEDLLDISKRSVDYAQAIYDLIKSRIPLGKAKDTDLSSAEVDLLNAKNTVISDETSYKQTQYALNQVLGDPIGKRYTVKSKLEFKKFKTPLEASLRILKETSPAVRAAKAALEQARIASRLARKNSLPLPVITFSGITLSQGYDWSNAAKTYSTTDAATSGNVNVSASLNFTIPLVGSGGLFGSRSRRAAEIAEEQAEISLLNTANQSEVTVRSSYLQIEKQEQTIENFQKLFKESNQVFENSLTSLQSANGFNRLDLKDAITQLRNSEIQLTSSILLHYGLKLQIAEAIGVDTFPEDKK